MANFISSSNPIVSLATIIWPPRPLTPRNVKCSNGASKFLSSGCRPSYVTVTDAVLKYRMVTTVSPPSGPVRFIPSITHSLGGAGVAVGPSSGTTRGAAVFAGTNAAAPPQATAAAKTAITTTGQTRDRLATTVSSVRTTSATVPCAASPLLEKQPVHGPPAQCPARFSRGRKAVP